MAGDAGIETRNVAGAITSMRIDELVSNLAIGIAQGQMQLDQVCMDIAQFMSEAEVAFGKKAGSDEPDLMSLIELGFTPNFYQFVDTILEVRVAVSTKFEETRQEDVSETQMHSDQVEEQQKYASQQTAARSGASSRSSSSYYSTKSKSGRSRAGQQSGSSSSSNYAYRSAASQSASSSSKATNLQCTTVDAKYASTYNYSVEASSVIKTKIVPVPPPTVFEEIVRAKVKERREWEERERLLDQVWELFPQLSASAKAIAGDSAYFPNAVATYKLATAQDLQKALADLSTTYSGITTPQWAVVGSVPDRAALDGFLSAMDAAMITALTCFNASGDMEEPEGVSLLDTLQAIRGAATPFAAKLDAVHARMFPVST